MKPKHSVNSTETPPLLSGITTADKYLAVLAAHEDWHRCIVDDYTFIDKPNKVSRKTTHGYIQRQLITDSKAEGEKFLEETEKIFADIVARFPGWQTPDPIIRYRPKQGMYYRQLRFTYDENEKFMQVIPEYLAIINADPSKLDFVFDKYAAARAKCCKFEYTTPSASAIKSKKTSTFEYDYKTAISKFIASLTSPEAKKTANHILKRHFEQFYKELFPQWVTEDITDTIDYYWVEANVSGGRTRETYDYIRDRYGECITNLIELAGIYYQRLCSECGIQPSDTFLRMFYPILYNEIELLKLKFGVLSGTSTESEKIIQNFQQKIWKNGLDSVSLRQLDNIINEIQNGQIQSKFGRLNRYGRPCNSSIAIRAAIIARGEDGADYPQPSDKRNAQTRRIGGTRITRQTELLIEFAKLSGCWISDFYEQPESYVILKGKKFKYLDKGYENRVYDSEDTLEIRKVIKIIDIPEDWEHLFYSDISEIFERIVIHNCLFKNSALNIIGFTNDNGILKVIIEQLFFKGDTPAPSEIETHIQNQIGVIHPIMDFYHNSDFYIGDLHDRNVIKDKKGNIIVIDCMLAFKDDDFKGFSGVDVRMLKVGDFIESEFSIVEITEIDRNNETVAGYIWNKLSETKPFGNRPMMAINHISDSLKYKYLRKTDIPHWIQTQKLFSNEILLIKQKYKPTKNR